MAKEPDEVGRGDAELVRRWYRQACVEGFNIRHDHNKVIKALSAALLKEWENK